MAEPTIEHVEPSVVAFLEMHGPYSQMPRAFGTLYGWIARHGLTPSGMPVGVYFTDPAVTPESDAAWELQAPLDGDPADAAVDAEACGVKHLDAHTEARVMHRGPYDSIASTYQGLVAWIAEHGYVMAGPPMEAYLSDPADTAPADYLTEVRFPVTTVD